MIMVKDDFLFSFIEEIDKELGACLRKVEEHLFSDAPTAALKGRVFIENLVKKIWRNEHQGAYKDQLYTFMRSDLITQIERLKKEEFITSEIQKDLHYIRQLGNKGAHEVAEVGDGDALIVHKKLYDVSKWFAEVYGTYGADIPDYESPLNKLKESTDIPEEKLTSLVEAKLDEMLRSKKLMDIAPKNVVEESAPYSLDSNEAINWRQRFEDLEISGSYLAYELSKLRASSSEAVDHADHFDVFKEYMHVQRPIENDLLEIVRDRKDNQKNLIFVCGNVGDGKSHLVAYLNQHEKELANQYKIINDATESSAPEKNAMQTLEELLCGFSDEKINEQTDVDKVILAINMGVLNNFINHEHENYHFTQLKQFIENSNLFTSKVVVKVSESNFDLLSFGDYHMYEITPVGADSKFYKALLQKICEDNEENPFYVAYKMDEEQGKSDTILHRNYELLMDKNVQHRIVQLLIKLMITEKSAIAAREFLDFIADVVLPGDYKNMMHWTAEEKLNQSLPALLFKHGAKSKVLKKLETYHPYHIRNEKIDDIIIRLNTAEEKIKYVLEEINNDAYRELMKQAFDVEINELASTNDLIEYFIIFQYLSTPEFAMMLEDEHYVDYLKYLYTFNSHRLQELGSLYKEISKAIFEWQGTPPGYNDYIYIENKSRYYLVAERLEVEPYLSQEEMMQAANPLPDLELSAFNNQITLGFKAKEKNEEYVYLNIDFSLYKMLRKVLGGYRPNKSDREKAVNFVQFVSSMLKLGNQEKEVLIHLVKEKRFYKISNDFFAGIKLERENSRG